MIGEGASPSPDIFDTSIDEIIYFRQLTVVKSCKFVQRNVGTIATPPAAGMVALLSGIKFALNCAKLLI